jgi:hypothetical protein
VSGQNSNFAIYGAFQYGTWTANFVLNASVGSGGKSVSCGEVDWTATVIVPPNGDPSFYQGWVLITKPAK